MLRGLDHLQRDVLPDLQAQVRWHAYLWNAELAGVLKVVRSYELKWRNDRMRHVRRRDLTRVVDTDVDVEECQTVPWEPTRLD